MNLELLGVKGFVGANAQGKTNILRALQEILSGKSDVRKIMDGKDKYHIRLEQVENGQVTACVSKIQTQKAARVEAHGLPVDETPISFVSKLLDEVAVNPIALIEKNPVEYLKQHLHPTVTAEDLKGFELPEGQFDTKLNPFDAAALAAEAIGYRRQDVGREMKREESVVADLTAALPQARAEAPEISKDQITTKLQEIAAESSKNEQQRISKVSLQDRLEKLNLAVEGGKKVIKEKHNQIENQQKQIAETQDYLVDSLAAQDSAYVKALAILKATHEKELANLENNCKKDKDSLIEKAEQECKKIKEAGHEAEKSLAVSEERLANNQSAAKEISAEIATIEVKDPNSFIAKVNELETIAAIHRVVEGEGRAFAVVSERQAKLDVLKKDYDALDGKYKFYAYTLPRTLINRCELPVEGIEFRDNELYVNDRHIDRLSSAERALVACKLVIALAKKKGHVAIAMDGIENLDKEHRAEFLKIADEETKNSGFCVLYTRVGEEVEAACEVKIEGKVNDRTQEEIEEEERKTKGKVEREEKAAGAAEREEAKRRQKALLEEGRKISEMVKKGKGTSDVKPLF